MLFVIRLTLSIIHNSFFKLNTGLLAVQWIVQVALQAVTNVGYAAGSEQAGKAPSVAAFSLALAVMPSYLDYKRATTPIEFDETHYGPDEVDDEEDEKTAAAKRAMAAKALANRSGKSGNQSVDSQVSDTIEMMEKKQKILEKSIVTLARQQRELEKSMKSSSSSSEPLVSPPTPPKQQKQRAEQPRDYPTMNNSAYSMSAGSMSGSSFANNNQFNDDSIHL